jgi:hypothetical protein
MIPEAIVTDIGVDQVKVTCRDEPIEDVAERAEHRSTKLTQGLQPEFRALRTLPS